MCFWLSFDNCFYTLPIHLLTWFFLFYLIVSPSKLADRKKSVAKKSTTPRSSTEEKPASTLNTGQIWEAPWLKNRKQVDKKPLKALGKLEYILQMYSFFLISKKKNVQAKSVY